MAKWRWWGPIKLALALIGCVAIVGIAIHVALVMGAVMLAGWEKDNNTSWIASSTIPVRTRLRQFEQQSPFVTGLVKNSPAELITYSPLGRDLDRQTYSEYYMLLFFCWSAGLTCYICYGGRADWRAMTSISSRIRKRQLFDRPPESRYPDFAEWCIYAVVSGEYCDAADFAEALRDRYESDWEPDLGRVRANYWYIYEVIRALPQLHRITGQRIKRRTARG